MKRSRFFLILVLILLVINTLFFVLWYGFDGKGVVRGIIEKEAGKALQGDFRIKTFSINDRQAFAENITFRSRDGNLNFTVHQARVRFNLFKFLFSGFRIRHILNEVTITKPVVQLKIVPSEKEKKAPGKFMIPDLRPIFNSVKVSDGSLDLDIGIKLNLGEEGILAAREKLRGIQISVINKRRSDIRLDASTANNGSISVRGYLDKGRIVDASGNISSFKPLYIAHPMLRDAGTEINLSLNVDQDSKDAPLQISGKAMLWNTRAYVLDRYPVNLPFIVAESDGDRLSINLSQGSIGSSSISGQASLTGLQKDLYLRSGSVNGTIDLAMLDPSISGTVSTSVQASGSLRQPKATARVSSDAIRVQNQQISGIALTAEYSDRQASFSVDSATWQNHAITAAGTADLALMTASASLGISSQGVAFGSLRLDSTADAKVNFSSGLPDVEAQFKALSVHNGDISFENMSGYVNLISGSSDIKPQAYYVDADLSSNDGQRLSVVGDVMDRSLMASAEFATIALADLIPGEAIRSFAPRVKGSVDGYMTGNKISASAQLFIGTSGDFRYKSVIDANASYDIATGDGGIILSAMDGSLNDEPLALQLVALKQGNKISVGSLRLNDRIGISAELDLARITNSQFQVMLRDLSTADLQKYLPGEKLKLPDLRSVTLLADYDPASGAGLQALLKVGSFVMPGLKTLSAEVDLRGPPEAIKVLGSVRNTLREVIAVGGNIDVSKGIVLDLKGYLTELSTADVVNAAPVEGGISGTVDFRYAMGAVKNPGMSLAADVSAPLIRIPGVPDLNDLYIKASSSAAGITVDTLTVRSGKLASVSGYGTLDYDPFTGEIGDGRGTMRVHAEGDVFPWLNRQVKYITDASGSAVLDCEIGTSEGQFRIASGKVDVRDGYLVLQDQSEAIRDISLQVNIDNNRVQISDTGFRMGNGKAEIENYFDDDPDTHFMVGFLDMGSFRIAIPEPGIQANVPFFTVPRSLSSVVLGGQNLPYATITGPFDDMKISAKVSVSEAEALYPPDTANLLNLISSFRGALSKPKAHTDNAQEAPLPFSLDLLVVLQDNVKYVTYPARLNIVPGSFLHITYQDQEWVAREANFNVDRGSIDFLGSVFQTDYLDITILDAQNVFVIDGAFYKRSPDGTVVTLNITTNRDTSLPLFDRLEFNLSSDNPRDRNISQILARLGSTGAASDLANSSEGDLLQDEALNLISDNLNASILSPFLYPIENQIRRILKLDGFSIKAGFIQNLFLQYTSDPNQIAEYMDMEQFMDDITRFSSSILLNNFSISASKYLGRKMFLDYQLSLQEATDLQKKTRILVSHDTSLRFFLPKQFKLAYTFKYEPQDEQLTHEVMLQRSFRFWGL